MTFEELLEAGSRLPEPEKERYTCNDCPDKEVCEFAFDLYNLDGDCLAEK
jgi:MoaA/NifB/PqqE/SkfB family radical SAM enzyme